MMSDHEYKPHEYCECEPCKAEFNLHIPITMTRGTWEMISYALSHGTDYYEQSDAIDEAIANYLNLLELIPSLRR